MKTIRLALMALVAAGLWAGVASAQEFVATVDLPCEVQWGMAVLPAGHYTIIQNSSRLPNHTSVRGEKGTVMVDYLFKSWNSKRTGPSTLILVLRPGRAVVTSLRISELGEEISYPQPGGENLIAQGPVLIQRIPISVRGK